MREFRVLGQLVCNCCSPNSSSCPGLSFGTWVLGSRLGCRSLDSEKDHTTVVVYGHASVEGELHGVAAAERALKLKGVCLCVCLCVCTDSVSVEPSQS